MLSGWATMSARRLFLVFWVLSSFLTKVSPRATSLSGATCSPSRLHPGLLMATGWHLQLCPAPLLGQRHPWPVSASLTLLGLRHGQLCLPRVPALWFWALRGLFLEPAHCSHLKGACQTCPGGLEATEWGPVWLVA